VIFPDQTVRIVIATKPVDLRNDEGPWPLMGPRKPEDHDGLASMAQAGLGFAPKTGVMVVFRSRRGDRVKVLFWVSHGRAIGPGGHGARAAS
jgi:transposase